MNIVKDIHTTTSNIAGFVLLGVLWAIADSRWWSCSNEGLQVLQNWTYGAIGLLLGTGVAIVARHYNNGEKLRYYTEMAVRLMFIYALITIALIKTEGYFYDLSLITKQYKLVDIKMSELADAFYGYSPFYQSFNGAILLGGLAMICFRNTQRAGALLLAATLAHSVVLNYSFDSCMITKNSIFLSAAMYLLYNDIFELFGFYSRSKPIVCYDWTPIPATHHLYKSVAVYKIVLLAGLLFYNHDYVKDIKNFKGRNQSNPIAGVWKVDKIDFLAGDISESIKQELEDFDKIIIDKDRFGAVEVGDSLSYFEFIVNPEDRQLEFWNFFDYREIDLKGKYEQISPDTLLYIGRNNKDSLQIVLTLEK